MFRRLSPMEDLHQLWRNYVFVANLSAQTEDEKFSLFTALQLRVYSALSFETEAGNNLSEVIGETRSKRLLGRWMKSMKHFFSIAGISCCLWSWFRCTPANAVRNKGRPGWAIFFYAHFKMTATYRCLLVTSINTRFSTGIYQKNLLCFR